jgi:hypothetical protein
LVQVLNPKNTNFSPLVTGMVVNPDFKQFQIRISKKIEVWNKTGFEAISNLD